MISDESVELQELSQNLHTILPEKEATDVSIVHQELVKK